MDHSQIIERVREAFRASMDEDKEVASLYDRVAKGAATYADADRFASIAGRKMGSILASELVDQEFAGELTLDMLRDVLPKTLWTDYDAVSKLTQQVQQALIEAAGLRMKAVPPVYDRQRVYGMAQEVARQHEEGSFAKHVTAFVEQVENLSMHTVDSSVEENARAQYDAGLQPKISRIQTGRCCKLCQELLGVYDYEKVKQGNKEVFWRHTSCRCQVLFQPGDGRVQNAHSKRWYSEEESATIQFRIEEAEQSNRNRIPRLFSKESTTLDDEIFGRSVGARFINADVLDLRTGERYHFAEGAKLQDKEVFAGKGTKTKYRKAWKYANKFNNDPEEWQHVKGKTVLETPDGPMKAEVHWSQCEQFGKVDFNVIRWIDE